MVPTAGPEADEPADDAAATPALPEADRRPDRIAELRRCNKQPPSGSELAEIKELFTIAIKAYQALDYRLAAEAFTNAYMRSCAPQVLYDIAMCLERMGERADAAAVLKLYLETSPDGPSVNEVRQLLDKLGRP